MSVTPTGRLAAPVLALRAMLSQCTTFQKITQSADAAAALGRIYFGGVAGAQTRPHAVVRLNEYTPSLESGGSRANYSPHGSLHLAVEFPVRWDGTLTGVTDADTFAASGLASLADDFFNGLRLTMIDGDQAGQQANVLDFAGSTGGFELASALPGAPEVGDTFHVSPADVADAEAHFLNALGAVLDELMDLSGTGGCLNLTRIHLADFGRSEEDKRDDYWGAMIEVEFGL